MRRLTAMLFLAGLAALARGDEMPHRKPGLWIIVSQPAEPARKAQTNRLCIDRSTEELLNRLGAGTLQQACTKNDIHVSGQRVTIHSECSIGGLQQASDATITFNGDSSYNVDVHAGAAHFVQEGKWAGACPAGMQPGDMVMTDSRGREMRTNLNKMSR